MIAGATTPEGEPQSMVLGQPPSDREAVIRIRNLKTKFGPKEIHHHLALDVFKGEVMGLVGGSGTGKSVLLRVIIGLIQQKKGVVEVFGQNTANLHGAALRRLQSRWGVLFQDGALFSSLTVAENIQVPLREHARLSERQLEEIAEWFRRMEPHSPLAYTLTDAVRRARLPLPELLAEVLPDEAARTTMLTMLGIRTPEPRPPG